MSYLFILIVVALLGVPSSAVEWSKFKTCSELGFCRRHRQYSSPPGAQFILSHQSTSITSWNELPAITAVLKSPDQPDLLLVILSFSNGLFRVVFDDVEPPPHPRHKVSDIIMPHVAPLPVSNDFLSISASAIKIAPPGSPFYLQISCNPFRIHLYSTQSDIPRISLNHDDRLLIDHFAKPPASPSPDPATKDSDTEQPGDEQQRADTTEKDQAESELADASKQCDGCWSETIKGNIDPKLRGPESVGVDIYFPFATHLYGIPERTVKFSLENTIHENGTIISEPNRLYNLDVFEFELDKQLGLYGAVPFIYARGEKDFVGSLLLNSAETYVDLIGSETGRKTHWYSETGFIDLFLFGGPTPSAIFDQYLWLTGRPAMPIRFALGYHQCRWNYRDDADVRAVDAAFDENRIPYDVIWLDIEHTDGKRYFTWDTERFPDATALQDHLASRGRKMVTIVDPHVKRDDKYSVHRLGVDENMYVKTPEGGDYDGWCWPGSSSYFDFTSERVRTMFGSLFCPEKYPHFSKNLHIWNDMNEPSVFNGPEGTMAKNLLHENRTEHRHIHNIFGHYYMQATYEGVRKGHGGDSRPFVLSRAFFAGSQRFGAIWTGDNTAAWDHLQSSVRMLLPLQITGIVFSGADVGGFFGNPSADLLTRWYQVGAFQPFFRGHAHLDTNRREPWLFGEPYTSAIANAIRARYELIAHWYTLFAGNVLGSASGLEDASSGPPMRPMWWEFGEDAESMVNERQWLVGSGLLVSPVVEEGVKWHKVYVPEGEIWYDLYAPDANGKAVTSKKMMDVKVGLERMVVFQRGGSIIPKQMRERRSSMAMSKDPFTLVVALDEKHEASGELYLDDGESFQFESGSFVVRRFEMRDGELKARTAGGSDEGFKDGDSVTVERIVVLGFGSKAPTSVSVGSRQIDFVLNSKSSALTLQRVDLLVGRGEWSVRIE